MTLMHEQSCAETDTTQVEGHAAITYLQAALPALEYLRDHDQIIEFRMSDTEPLTRISPYYMMRQDRTDRHLGFWKIESTGEQTVYVRSSQVEGGINVTLYASIAARGGIDVAVDDETSLAMSGRLQYVADEFAKLPDTQQPRKRSRRGLGKLFARMA